MCMQNLIYDGVEKMIKKSGTLMNIEYILIIDNKLHVNLKLEIRMIYKIKVYEIKNFF